MALTQTEVSELYVAIFNRAGEGEGNEYWQNAGLSAAETADEMLATPDAQEYFGTSLDTNQAFIEYIYENTLNKTIEDDPDGIAFWVGLLDDGMSQGEVIASLVEAVNAPENVGTSQDQFNNRVEVSDYTADTIFSTPTNYKVDLGFSENLVVTDDVTTVEIAQSTIMAMPSDDMGSDADHGSENSESDFVLSSEYLDGSTMYEVYDADGDGVYEGLISMEFSNGTLIKTDGTTIETLTYTIGEDEVLTLSDGSYISVIKDMGDNKLATAWYDDLDSATNATMSSSHKDDAFKFVYTSMDAVDSFLNSDGSGSDEDHGNSSVESDFDFSDDFLANTTLYNVLDEDGDGIYESLISMEFLDGTLTNTDEGVVEVLNYTVDENGIISLSDGTYISGLVNIVDENKIATAWYDNDLDSALNATAETAQEDGSLEYIFTDLESATNFIA